MPPELKQTPNAKSAAGAKALGERDSGVKKSNSELVFKECDELEEEIAALKVTYEQYFLGNERLAPARAHEDLKKRLMRLKGSMVRNTAAKFRMNSIHNKFLTYERLWQRTLQEIEAGTYKRDLFKAKRRTQKAPADGERRQEVHELEELSDDDLVEVAPIIPNEPVPAKPARPSFIPRPVEDSPTFRPAAAPVPVVPLVPTVPTVSPVASGTPFRGTATVAPTVPSIPTVAPTAGTPARGTAVAPAGSTPSRGTPTIPPGGTPSKGTPTIPPGGTPSRGTSTLTGTPARGVPTFGSPSQGMSGIAAALESLTDEPLTRAPSASTPARPTAPTAARPAATAAKPGAPTASRPATPAAAAKPAAGSGPGLSDDKLKAVYDAYVTAKRRNQEDTSKMSYESVAANLRKQVPELLKQSGAKSVEFKVVIKDGKATLKAVPK